MGSAGPELGAVASSFVYTVMNLWLTQNAGNFLTSSGTIQLLVNKSVL
jgi:hypothetical protein